MLADSSGPEAASGPWQRRLLDVRLVAAALLLAYLGSGIYAVSADQQAVVVRLGRVQESRVPARVHWTRPSPLARVDKPRRRETKPPKPGLEKTDPTNPSQFLPRARDELDHPPVV